MRKLDFLQQKKLSAADELRELLDLLEERKPGITKMNPTQALFLLRDLDQVYTLFNTLKSDTLDLTAEIYRFETVQNYYKRNADKIQKALGGAEAIRQHRPSPEPEEARWWWYTPKLVATRQQQALRRTLITFIMFLFIVGGIVLLFETVLAPSPEAIARNRAEINSFEAFEAGDLNKVIAAIDEGLAVVPNDPGLLIIKGVAQEQMGDEMAANQTFEQARTNLPDPASFYLTRAQVYYRVNAFDKVEADSKTALEFNEKLSLAWLLLGQALEAQGRRFEAVPAYQQAGEVGMENGDNEVVVLARMALGRVGGMLPP